MDMDTFILTSRQQDLFLSVSTGIILQFYLSTIFEPAIPRIAVAYLGGNLILNIYLLIFNTSIRSALLHQGLLNAIFVTTFVVLTIIRRLYFHPLSRFPGPRLAAISKLYNAYFCFRGEYIYVIRDQHKKYGDIVRTGPNELAINNVEALEQVFSRKSGSIRGEAYELRTLYDGTSIITERDWEAHKHRREIWTRALASKELARYAERVEGHVRRFAEVLELEGTGGRAVDISLKSGNLTADTMGDLGFGKYFELQRGKTSKYIEAMHNMLQLGVIVGSLRPFAQLAPYLPKPRMSRDFLSLSNGIYAERLPLGASRPDVFSHLLSGLSQYLPGNYKNDLVTEVRIFMLAAADTTTGILACMFMEVARSPRIQEKLWKELDAAFPDPVDINSITIKSTSALTYVDAVVHETLRRWNSVPEGAQYMTPKTGCTIDGTFVPGRINVRSHPYTLMLDERYFSHAEVFIPERWTDQPELIKNRKAFIPFSYGPHSCPGKQLALQQIRLALSLAARLFTLSLEDGFDYTKFHTEGVKDYSAVKVEPIWVKANKRA